MARLATMLALMVAAQAISGGAAWAAQAGPDPVEVRRGFAAVGPKASDQPALRQEQQTRPPSAGFGLGAALGAWLNAAAQLDYDLKTPSGDGGDDAAIEQDCYEERVAFASLEERRAGLVLTPPQVTAAAGVADPALLPAWQLRLSGAPRRCR